MTNGFNPYGSYNSGMNWVIGIEGAKAWPMRPNDKAVLFDSENEGVFYIKVSDNIGMCSLRTFNYTEVVAQPAIQPGPDLSEYVKKSELQELLENMLGGGTK